MSPKLPRILVWNGRLLMVGAVLFWLLPLGAAVSDWPEAFGAWQFWALSAMPLLWAIPGFLMQRLGSQLRAPASSVSLRSSRS